MMVERKSSPEEFYDRLGSGYNDAIERCVPRYREMLWAILRYIPDEADPRRILELGSGSGNLTELLLQRYPQASIHCVDFSGELNELCRQRFASHRVTFQQSNFEDIRLEPETFDLVVSSISIHHIDDAAKQSLFRTLHEALVPHGIFSYSDQFAGATEEINRKHVDLWKEETAKLGIMPEEWDVWMRHQHEHDHHASLSDQMSWLRGCGFKILDCPWRYLLWTVVYAAK